MLKIIGLSLLTCLTLVPLHADAQTVNLNLAPKESKMLSNNFAWTINATCTVQTNGSKKTILVNAVKNTSTVNGKNLSSGQKTSVTVHNNDNFTVSAEPGAQVAILNLSVENVQASCST